MHHCADITVCRRAHATCGGIHPRSAAALSGSRPAPFSTTDLIVGDGAEAAAGQRVTVHYTGWLYSETTAENNGRQFDSSRNPGRTPYVFILGTWQVIAGWDQGVPGMRVGGTRRLVIPPELAYGSNPHSGIPVNATLRFDVELISIPSPIPAAHGGKTAGGFRPR